MVENLPITIGFGLALDFFLREAAAAVAPGTVNVCVVAAVGGFSAWPIVSGPARFAAVSVPPPSFRPRREAPGRVPAPARVPP